MIITKEMVCPSSSNHPATIGQFKHLSIIRNKWVDNNFGSQETRDSIRNFIPTSKKMVKMWDDMVFPDISFNEFQTPENIIEDFIQYVNIQSINYAYILAMLNAIRCLHNMYNEDKKFLYDYICIVSDRIPNYIKVYFNDKGIVCISKNDLDVILNKNCSPKTFIDSINNYNGCYLYSRTYHRLFPSATCMFISNPMENNFKSQLYLEYASRGQDDSFCDKNFLVEFVAKNPIPDCLIKKIWKIINE